MSVAIDNVQKYSELITEKIPKLIKSMSCELGDYSLQFEPMVANNSIPITQNGTEYYSIKAECILTNKVTNECIKFFVELLKIPILQELGFKIHGSFMQQLDVYEKTTGWNFYADKTKGECANLTAENKRSIYFNLDSKVGPYVRFLLHGEKKNAKVHVSTLFRAISGSSNEELISLFGYNNPYVISAFSAHADNRTVDKCIEEVAEAILNNKSLNRTILMLKSSIESDMFSARYFPLGSSNASRLNYFQSFSYRANGRRLAQSVNCNGYRFDKGIILSAQELDVLDKLPITELQVEFNDKVYHLRKFSKFTFDVLGCTLGEDLPELDLKSGRKLAAEDVDKLNESNLTSVILAGNRQITRRKHAYALTQDDLYTAFGIWTDNLNGFEQHSKQFEITNRVLISYDKKIESCLMNSLSTVVSTLSKNLKEVDCNGRLAVAIKDCSQGVNTDAFIESIVNASNNAGQMADMCNILAYTAKSGKATANLGKATATDEMVNVQDMQEGRLDPLDVPESDKIGSVHYRTLFSKLNDSGDPTSPFLRVLNGEVVSEEPVYLTAIEEMDKYIAEWDETFHNEDGSLKDRVRVRCNGAVITVEVNRVLYKEYSPYQNLSVSHSMVPFPGHSAGKRITMACNQAKQAVPFADGGDRPLTMSGGESLLGIGYVSAKDVLSDFYNKNKHLIAEPKEVVMSSDLKLERINTEFQKRTYSFRVLAVTSGSNEVTLTLPYGLKTYEQTMFSFNLNPKTDCIYKADDIVAYNNGYSLEKKELVKCADFGAQKVDDSVFDSSTSLVRNLKVAYKTFEGSVIEDGITICSKLVYNDKLTHIEMFEISDVATKSNDLSEVFRTDKAKAPEYLASNGLPIKGTYLKPGMIAISKCSTRDGDTKSRYTRVPTYVEGQVIYSELTETPKGIEATVVLAKRAYVHTGDKMAGRCGNKGVIARIVDETDMPFCEDTGEVADIILNPLGVPSRMNITQLLDGLLSYCMDVEGKIALVTPYNKNDVDFVRERAKADNIYPKIMIDGRTGRRFERPINFCVLPMYKLHHTADKKIHSVGMDASLDSTFLQPTKGSKMNGGQSIGEMETWCLESVGATVLLNELFTLQSDDIESQHAYLTNQVTNHDYHPVAKKNSNDLAMQTFYRSMGIEFGTDVATGCYTFEPLTDDTIRSLYLTPITNRSMLHATSIFGSSNDVLSKARSRSNWGWIDLHTKMIMPIWIYKGGISKVIGVGTKSMKSVIQCEKYLRLKSSTKVVVYDSVEDVSEDEAKECMTGMSALVYVFEHFNTISAEIEALSAYNKYVDDHAGDTTGSGAQAKLAKYRLLADFNKSGKSLRDYVVTSLPVMPQTYRPEIKVAGRNTIPDFDWYYTQILNVAAEVSNNDNAQTERQLFNAILEFTGLDDAHSNKSYKSLLKFFCAKGAKGQHGKIRENVQSKRIMCSGRCAIIPAADITRTPLEIGVPFTMMVTMYKEKLYAHFKQLAINGQLHRKKFDDLMLYLALRDHARFNELFEQFTTTFMIDFENDDPYNVMTQIVIEFLEGRNGNPKTAVCAGRQPSLHKYSVRAFRPYIVFDNVAHLHPLLCTGFNADFDGDQMYFYACLTEEAIDEALEKLSPAKDLILPKDGSIVLKHSQDIVLGVYCATMLKDNATVIDQTINDAKYYDSLESMYTDLRAGFLNTYDLVVYTCDSGRYLSTAGRILFNSLLLGFGFTDKPFTNQLGIEGVKLDCYNDLKYDGLVGSGSTSNGITTAVNYYSLPAICKEMYESLGSASINVFQAITEFGFEISDITGVSLSLYDFDIEFNKQEILKEAEITKTKIEQDYQDGLISEEDKRNAVIALYGDSQNGANTRVLKDLLKHLPRNNNIFIMMDSGARGNKSQVMQMMGCVGILQKSKTEDLETSVTQNYYEGLNSFDVHLTSYSARTGVASSQNETKRSGYATHKVVYMASGAQIVESDCGAADQRFDIEWGDHDPTKDRFMPTREWYKEHLVGEKISEEYTKEYQLTTNGVFTEDDYTKLRLAKGFHELHLNSGVVMADVFNAKGLTLSPDDSVCRKYLKHNKNKYQLSVSSIKDLLKHKVNTIKTTNGVYTIRYNMTDCCKSLMEKRVGYNLPGLKMVRDSATGEDLGIITKETVKYIEDNKIDSIKMRTTLRCKSKHGFCAHCYGLKFSDGKFPEVGSFVGTESAQSIAEPASQLTLNVINKGGAAGASSVTSGVQVFDNLLSGSAPSDDASTAILAKYSGYVSISKLDKLAAISIIPENFDNPMCQECMKANRSRSCPRNSTFCQDAKCQLEKRRPYNTLTVQDGEWVNAGDKLTNFMIYPDSIVHIDSMDGKTAAEAAEELHVKRQRIWIANYFNTFKDSGISVFARHFEIIANIQNRYVQVTNSNNSNKKLGGIYEFNEVLEDVDNIKIRQFVSQRSDVVLRNSGAFAALSFENVAEVAANLVVNGYRENINQNHSLISALSIGENLTTPELKVLNKPKYSLVSSKKKEETVEEPNRLVMEEVKDVAQEFSFENIDFEKEMQAITAFDNTVMSEDDNNTQDAITVKATVEDVVRKYSPEDFDYDEDLGDFAEDTVETEEKSKPQGKIPTSYKNVNSKEIHAF